MGSNDLVPMPVAQAGSAGPVQRFVELNLFSGTYPGVSPLRICVKPNPFHVTAFPPSLLYHACSIVAVKPAQCSPAWSGITRTQFGFFDPVLLDDGARRLLLRRRLRDGAQQARVSGTHSGRLYLCTSSVSDCFAEKVHSSTGTRPSGFLFRE